MKKRKPGNPNKRKGSTPPRKMRGAKSARRRTKIHLFWQDFFARKACQKINAKNKQIGAR